MELIKLTNNIFYSQWDTATDRPILGYIKGSKFPLMVDGGNSAAHVKDYLDGLNRLGLPVPKYCIITHWHWDHTFGIHALPMDAAACSRTNKELHRMSAWKWDGESMKQRLTAGEEIQFAHEHILAEYPNTQDIQVVTAPITFEEKLTIDCGGLTCQCIQLPSAHSDDSVVVYIPEEKVIFIGDIYNDDLYNNRYRDLEKTRQLYEELNKIDFNIAIPGHSQPIPRKDILNFLKGFLS